MSLPIPGGRTGRHPKEKVMKVPTWLLAASLACPLSAVAQAPAAAPAASAVAMADGEVRKVDKAQARITLRHGPIASLDMPPMTMVFRVADPGLLDGVKEGDKVRFAAERVNGVITLTAVERAR